MEIDIKREARRQYLHFFRIWFIVVGILFVVAVLTALVKNMLHTNMVRGNMQAPAERVYDYADLLTDEEEEALRSLIADKEALIGCDLVLVTMRQPVEGSQAQEDYGYRYTNWELNMQDLADDFYDNNQYGFDAPYGDGALILDNSYSGQEGTHLSTSGRVFAKFGNYEIDQALNRVDAYIDSDPYKAYSSCINYIADKMSGKNSETGGIVLLLALIVPLIAAGVFVATHLRSKEGKTTTTATTYIAGGKPVMNQQRDDFVRKHVTQMRLQPISASGGSGGGGYGGAHRMSGCNMHGGRQSSQIKKQQKRSIHMTVWMLLLFMPSGLQPCSDGILFWRHCSYDIRL
ncbi:MAG: TPM domain-containing protein [Acetatifactor sp.]|nr:TPM domain-containing protein [Acetatifactor sp.]